MPDTDPPPLPDMTDCTKCGAWHGTAREARRVWHGESRHVVHRMQRGKEKPLHLAQELKAMACANHRH